MADRNGRILWQLPADRKTPGDHATMVVTGRAGNMSATVGLALSVEDLDRLLDEVHAARKALVKARVKAHLEADDPLASPPAP